MLNVYLLNNRGCAAVLLAGVQGFLESISGSVWHAVFMQTGEPDIVVNLDISLTFCGDLIT